jgi:hypothetical protein
LELIGDVKYSEGTSVYTAQNRFSIRDFAIYTGRLELKNPNYFIRAWGVTENSGDTYDAGTAALLMNESWKPSEKWFEDYIGAFTQNRLLGSNEESVDSFVTLVLKPSRHKKIQSSVVPDSRNPEYNENFFIACDSLDQLHKSLLKVKVYNRAKGT